MYTCSVLLSKLVIEYYTYLFTSTWVRTTTTLWPPLKLCLFPCVRRIKDPDHRIAWKDFAEFTADTPVRLLDYHFQPVWSLCEPCEHAYNYVVKSETAERDESWLLKRLNITDVKLGRQSVPPGGSLVNSNPSDKIKFYMSQLSDKTRRKLYEIYENDFKVFGYAFDFETLESDGFDWGLPG